MARRVTVWSLTGCATANRWALLLMDLHPQNHSQRKWPRKGLHVSLVGMKAPHLLDTSADLRDRLLISNWSGVYVCVCTLLATMECEHCLVGTFTRLWVWQQLTEFCILNLVYRRYLLEATFEFCLAFLQPTTGIPLSEDFPVLWVLYGKQCWKVQIPCSSLLCWWGQTYGLSLTNTVTLDRN